MILIKCTKSVVKHFNEDYIEDIKGTVLFKEGHMYMAYENSNGQFISEDEEGTPHIIADGDPSLIIDHWFDAHFRLL